MVDITNYFDFENNIEKEVKIIGRIAEEIWQHITMFADSHPYMNYFDLDDGHQIVIYTKDEISCKAKLEVTGKIVKVESKHKNPRSKITDKYFEYQLLVDSWKCIES
ncbi:MAG: hypothetical protein ACFFFT_05830 [Candidatus Thorarchaeota archaeon]